MLTKALNTTLRSVVTGLGADFADPLPVFNPASVTGGSEIVDIPTICLFTNMCPGGIFNPASPFADIHPTDTGYATLAVDRGGGLTVRAWSDPVAARACAGPLDEAPRIPPFVLRYGTSTPSTKSWIRPAPSPPELTVSEPARVLTSSRSFAASAWRMPIAAARPVTFTPAASPLTAMVSLPAVPLTMTRSAAPSPVVPPSEPARSRLTLLTPVPVRSLTVIDVGAAEGVEVDGLDAGGVHRDVAGVAEEPEPASVGGDVDLFGRGGAVEDHPVVAVLALDDVAAVAGIPDERVVSGAHESGVGSAVAVDRVVPVAADRLLDARPPAIRSPPRRRRA